MIETMSVRAPKRRKLSDVEVTLNGLDEYKHMDNVRPISANSLRSSPFPDFDSNSDSSKSSSSGTDNSFSDNGTDAAVRNECNLPSTIEKSPIAQKSRPSKKRNVAQSRLELKNYNGNISRSELLQLQVNELLGQVRLSASKRDNEVDTILRSLKKTIESIPRESTLSVHEAERSLRRSHGIAIPFPRPRPPRDAMYKLGYEKPDNINVTGSYPFRLTTKLEDTLTIDLVVTIPKKLLEEKDYLDYRFFHKRAYYIACIAAGIRKAEPNKYDLQYAYMNENPNLPVVIACLKDVEGSTNKPKRSFKVQILAAAADDAFPTKKILPERTCVRLNDDSSKPSTQRVPTPFYNSSVRAQCTVNDYLKLFHGSAALCDGYRNACLLGRIWLRQRGLCGSASKGGFGNFEWAAVLAILLHNEPGSRRPLISQRYNSFQLFKAVIQYLGSADLLGQSRDANNTSSDNDWTYPTFFDEQRQHNILFKMTTWSYHVLKREARSTLAMLLRDSVADHFESLFILRTDALSLRFDLTVTVPIAFVAAEVDNDEILSLLRNICQKLFRVLKRGLNDRARLISIQLPKLRAWEVNAEATEAPKSIVAAIDLDAANTTKVMDYGPLAEKKDEAASFRRFWGEKAELRRFKDGSIMESLVWSKKNTSSIAKQIVEYLLERHFGKDAAERAVFSCEQPMKWVRSRMTLNDTSLSEFHPLLESYNRLERNLRALEGLPLQIRHIFPASPQLRYASLEAPTMLGGNERLGPAEVVLLFESSSQWPDNLSAVQGIKVAFLLKTAELLEDVFEDVNARLGLENKRYALENQAFLDINFDNGMFFRIRIHHDREIDLLNKQLKDGDIGGRNREEAAGALAAYKRIFLRRPTHTQHLQALCTRYPSLSTSIRMLKEWFSSHLLSKYFPEELIELFAVHIYLHPSPWTTPSSALTAFLRALSLLSRWNWREEPFVVDLDGSIDASMMASIRTRFTAWRKLDPALNRVVMFVATPADLDGTIWTDHGYPSKVIATRMTALARACSRLVDAQDLSFDFPTLFASPLIDYDFLLHLNPRHCSSTVRYGENGDYSPSDTLKYKNLAIQGSPNTGVAVSGVANLVSMFVDELSELYGHAALFFHGARNLGVIAGLWVPSAAAKRGWKVRLGYSSVPCLSTEKSGDLRREEGKEEAYLSKDGILNEICRLGGELIDKVEIVKR